MTDATFGRELGRLTQRVLPEVACRRRAGSQLGLVTREQALSFGMSSSSISRALSSGRWERLFPGVYRVASAAPRWQQEVAGASLWAGDVTAASHRCAAALWSIEGFKPGRVEITSSRKLRNRRADVVVHFDARFARQDVARLHSLPVTTPTRTIIDLAAETNDRLEEVVEDVLRRRLTTPDRLARALAKRGPHVPGVRRVRKVVAELMGDPAPSGSRFEVLLRRLLTTSGLPRPVPQWPISDGDRLVAIVDLAYPNARLALEAQSFRWHSDSRAWARDQSRWNELAALGWQVRIVTWKELCEAPAKIVDDVRRALASREARLPGV